MLQSRPGVNCDELLLMARADSLLAGVAETSRQLVVGDSIHHSTFGDGRLIAGWEGHLEVQFKAGAKLFTDLDDIRLVATDLQGAWLLLSPAEALAQLAEHEKQRANAFATVQAAFQTNFIQSEGVFKTKGCRFLTRPEFENEKIKFVQRWIEKSMPVAEGQISLTPDPEQALAISTVVGHVQVVARAGSGKTETVANRAVFLQKHCGVAPDEMMLLAFNKTAATELSKRIASKLDGGALPHIMTFHALAYAIVPGAKNLLVNKSDGGDQSLNQEFQNVLMDAIEDPAFEFRIRQLMLAHFRADWEEIISNGLNLTRKEMLKFRRSLVSETMRGEYVKSYGEKVIANFLFEHDVPYRYEENHWWSGRNYRPDFTIPKYGSMSKGVIIEYFGLEGDPDYDEQTLAKRKYWESKASDWVFVELSPTHLAENRQAFERELSQALVAARARVIRLSEDEIWHRARTHSILRFIGAISGFVGRCRKQWLTPVLLRQKVTGHAFMSDIERWFVEISVDIFGLYLDRLQAIDAEDFDGLMQRAVSVISDGKSCFSRADGDGDLRRLRYLFVDEYQDFTELFHRMVAAVRLLNPQMEVFCVGDDWQAINRFAGSDLKYFRQFKSIFNPARQLRISTNRRSKDQVVRVSNALMHGRGSAAVSATREPGRVTVVDLADFKPTSLEESLFKRSLITPVALRLAGKALGDGKSVVLLSAKNELIDSGGGKISLDRYLKALKAKLPLPFRDGLSISTAHGFKGNQADVVIILDAMEGNYPLIHPNWIFTRILGESLEAIVDESRRLFYVAMTRAKEDLFILTEQSRESPFLNEILTKVAINLVDWQDYPPIVASNEWLTVKVSGNYEAVKPLIEHLKADGFRYRDLSTSGGRKTWDRSYRSRELMKGFLVESPWMTFAGAHRLTGVEVRLFDGLDGCLMSCDVQQGKLMMPTATGQYEEFNIMNVTAAVSA